MGAWGREPWDNDGAADWFGGLWEGTPIVERVEAGLRSEDSDEIVAALWLCDHLCRVYVWPVASYDQTLDLAIAAGQRILEGEDDDGYLEMWEHEPSVVARQKEMRDRLKARKAGPET